MPDNPTQPKPAVLPPQEPPPEPPILSEPVVSVPSPPPEPETPIKPVISPATGGKGISKKLVVGLFALFFLLGSIPAGVFLVGQRQEIREKAATSAPDCPAGYTEVKVYGECCGYLKAKEVRECAAPTEEGGYTYTYPESDCVHDAPSCTEGAPPPPPPSTWDQCNADSSNPPCGSCSIYDPVKAGEFTFGCELNCGNDISKYCSTFPSEYQISGNWIHCKDPGTKECFVSDTGQSGPLTSLTPSKIGLQTSFTNGKGIFPLTWGPYSNCGRVQVDIIMKDTGTSVAGKVYNTGNVCAGVTPVPTSPPPPSGGVSCNYDQVSLGVSPNPQQVGGSVTFSITGDASTYVQDSWTGGVDCQGDFASSKTCKATAAGNFSWTHQWRHCEGSFNNCSGVCSESANFTITAPPTYTHTCNLVKVYDTNWTEITNLANIKAGQTVRFTTSGQTSEPQGITKARIRVNNGAWQETTNKKPNTGEFYIDYTIPAAGGSFTVEAEVYNPTLGWK